ncbi:3-isopropylmalate dehydratase, small subunit [Candidatus Nitrososphaera evergladensis SR1]|jgi:3-isopropylmalate/(R)-2-methylmalate dehydratase small subunit|uniref:3-isopropylmalate dehydratase n=1 Tax=Candidatus Nitrososphaera evergladensis SR1 TaxID=1459636 RepID=A0A075MT40_9ARCH|nr:3-isopropylmalate dehydratase small subunit [Candidatus Nitrososphaera evergladensis]AIF84380.1 3-isopropylmalate dehydratase, small subunit [Candidatus Nitrososphaera evergladensis SR1]
MEPFTVLKSKATPLDRVNVDTDQIVPKQFLKLVSRSGFGQYLFYDWRFDAEGRPRPDFVLNDPKYKGRQILLARDNFGSGSSREHAAWAILDYGFRAVVAPSFADIFYNNCFKNGVLPVRLAAQEVDYLFQDDGLEIEIDLAKQTVRAGQKEMHFEIDDFRKKLLLEGLDSIGLTLKLDSEISKYERQRQTFAPSL